MKVFQRSETGNGGGVSVFTGRIWKLGLREESQCGGVLRGLIITWGESHLLFTGGYGVSLTASAFCWMTFAIDTTRALQSGQACLQLSSGHAAVSEIWAVDRIQVVCWFPTLSNGLWAVPDQGIVGEAGRPWQGSQEGCSFCGWEEALPVIFEELNMAGTAANGVCGLQRMRG